MILKQILAGALYNFSYIVADEKTKEAAVIDASETDSILHSLEKDDLKLKYIISTHSHFDHISFNEEIAKKTGAKIVLHKLAKTKKDVAVDDGDELQIGSLKIKIIHTPGHTRDGICLLVGNKLFTGDTLFVGECGRTDFPGGSSEQLYDSLEKIKKMDDRIEVYPGHNYGNRPHSTIGYEKKSNYTLKKRTKEEFVKFMLEP